MTSDASARRLVGVLLLVQLLGLIVPFILIEPIVHADFLTSVAASAGRVRIGALLLLVNAGLTVGISTVAMRAWRAQPGLAHGLFAAALAWLVLQAVDYAHILSMLALSERATAAGAQLADFGMVGDAARSARRHAHYLTLFAIESWFFLFYWAAFRERLVPRVVGWIALAMPLLHAVGISLPVLLAFRSTPPLAFALLLSDALVIGWLLFVPPRAASRPDLAHENARI